MLLAEDDGTFRRLMAATLRKRGYLVDELQSGSQLLDRLTELALRDGPVDLIVSDVRMPGIGGLEVIRGLRSRTVYAHLCDVPVILITAFGSDDLHDEAEDLGATMFDKPFDLHELVTCAVAMAPPEPEPIPQHADPDDDGRTRS